jgi:hypothetical protein
MNGLIVMGALVLVVGGIGWSWGLSALTRKDRRYVALIPVGLPMSAAVNLLVKAPLIMGIAALAGLPPTLTPATPFAMILFLWAVSPITEEATKLVPLLIPSLRRRVTADANAALWSGMAVGIGYGLGEAAYLAYNLSSLPEYRDLPWYLFTGFFFERQLTLFVHGVLAAVSYSGFQRGGRWRWTGYLAAAGLHALTNAGAVLARVGLLPAGVASLWLIVIVFALSLLLDRLRRQAHMPERVEVLFQRSP